MFINLYNKPEWYEEIVPTKLVPAVSIRGRLVWESANILKASILPFEGIHASVCQLMMQDGRLNCTVAICLAVLQALDEEFSERPLYPADPKLAEEGKALSKASDETVGSWLQVSHAFCLDHCHSSPAASLELHG
jgi:glutathione S-transferase